MNLLYEIYANEKTVFKIILFVYIIDDDFHGNRIILFMPRVPLIIANQVVCCTEPVIN